MNTQKASDIFEGENSSLRKAFEEAITPKEAEWSKECVFCKMQFPDTEVLNIEPLNPVVVGHRIFIPKEHVADFAENADVTIKTMYAAQQYAKEMGGEFNIITSAGESATQSVFHLHVHFVPRRENDGLLLPWHSEKALSSQRTKDLEAIREAVNVKQETGIGCSGRELECDNYNSGLDDALSIVEQIMSNQEKA